MNFEAVLGTSTARRKLKVKSQKSKVLWNKLFRAFQWSAYLRRAVLVQVVSLLMVKIST